MNILFLSAWYPYPTNNGSRLRIFNLLKGIAHAGHKITLISFEDQPLIDKAGLADICCDIITIPWESGQLTGIRKRLAPLNRTPHSFLDTFSDKMVGAIEAVLAQKDIDIVIASQIKAAAYGEYLKGIPAIFEELELGVMHDQPNEIESLLHRSRYKLTWYKHKNFVEKVFDHYQACTVVSSEEKVLFEKNINQPDVPCHVIPNGVDVAQYVDYQTSKKKKNTLIYTGSYGFFANYDAMVWFVGKVLPIIQERVPDVKLTITGDHKNKLLPENSAVKLVGFVDDIRPLIAESAVSLAPLLVGGGTRLKILEAMALCTPVVATSKGAQGLDAIPGVHYQKADAPRDFADEVVRLLHDDSLAQSIADEAYALVHSKYDWGVILPQFMEVVECLKK
ncbi:MAG: glycosyltransferase family 4 protein [Chloroflexota bacterium]